MKTELPPHPLGDARLSLYAWQEEAFSAWESNEYRGIVEAVTGAGKTRLGIAAVSAAVREGRQVVVLVPTIELLHQWYTEIRAMLPWVRVGRQGDQHRADFYAYEVVISTVQGALALTKNRGFDMLHGSSGRLLVADEVHRLAAEHYSAVLDLRCEWRLGISATYERTDELHIKHLDPYFDGVVYRLWYERAQADNLIAPFDIALVGVELGQVERQRYDDLTEEIGKAHRSLQGYLGQEMSRSADFFVVVASWAAEDGSNARNALARKYLRAVSARQQLLAQTEVKLEQLELLRPALEHARGALIFSLTQQGAEAAAARVAQRGIRATAVFSEVPTLERKQRMASFRAGSVQVLAAPRVLDEGVDVPEADLGIVLAANRSKRQIVQRLGRIIRRKRDGRAGKFVYLYASDTIEDPEIRGEEYLNEVLPHARDLGWFAAPHDREQLLQFLVNEPPQEPPPAPRPGSSVRKRCEGRPAPEDLPEWDGEAPEQLRGITAPGPDLTKFYLEQIGQYPLLTALEEVELGQAIEAGVLAHERIELRRVSSRRELRELRYLRRIGRAAHRRFVCSNLRLVVSIAKKYVHSAGTLDLLDLIQEGNLGLERAVQKWDYTLGNKFSTYAQSWIRQMVTRSLADASRTIRLPVHVVDQLNAARRIVREAETSGADDQGALLIAAKETEQSVEKVMQLFAWERPPLDLDGEMWVYGAGSVERTCLGEMISDEHATGPDARLSHEAISSHLENMLLSLTHRQEQVLRLRHGLSITDEYGWPLPQTQQVTRPQTLDEIGARLGVTRERIRQIESQSLTLLREKYDWSDIAELLPEG